ncbi:MAG: protein translocase subunit SecF [Deltaproteobacteria bacterium]|nr:MAG: protein translocase subunit SecF [Deltaproteobacteria bacterium]
MASSAAKYNFDLMGRRSTFGMVSAALVLLALLALVVWPGPNYGIDFAGGTDIIVRFNGEVTDGDIRQVVEQELGFESVSVQRFGSASDNEWLIQTRETSAIQPALRQAAADAIQARFGEGARVEYSDTSGDRFFVHLPDTAYDLENADEIAGIIDPRVFAQQAPALAEEIDAIFASAGLDDTSTDTFGNPADRRFLVRVRAIQSVLDQGLRDSFGDVYANIERVETVGPRVGAQLRNDGIKAVLLALIGILIYIAVRFDLRYAPGAVAALAHDVLITLGLLMLLGEEINLTIVAALLTIVGYSLNDTIVNFDRIRENIELAGDRFDIVELTNRSLNECLSRTILTSTTTLLAVGSIFFLGGGLIQSFGLAMIIGVIIGTYSSIYIAAPIFMVTSRYLDAREAEREKQLKLSSHASAEL